MTARNGRLARSTTRGSNRRARARRSAARTARPAAPRARGAARPSARSARARRARERVRLKCARERGRRARAHEPAVARAERAAQRAALGRDERHALEQEHLARQPHATVTRGVVKKRRGLYVTLVRGRRCPPRLSPAEDVLTPLQTECSVRSVARRGDHATNTHTLLGGEHRKGALSPMHHCLGNTPRCIAIFRLRACARRRREAHLQLPLSVWLARAAVSNAKQPRSTPRKEGGGGAPASGSRFSASFAARARELLPPS